MNTTLAISPDDLDFNTAFEVQPLLDKHWTTVWFSVIEALTWKIKFVDVCEDVANRIRDAFSHEFCKRQK